MAKRTFFDFFPVPRYLKQPAVGFDVSDGSVKFVELIEDAKGIRIGHFGKKEFEFPTEIDSNNIEPLVKTLKDIKKEFGIERANVSLPEEQAYFIRLRLPAMMKKEMRTSIELQLEEYIPYSPNEVIFDYELIKENSDGSRDVSVSVLTQAVINKYLNIFGGAGITPLSFEVEAESTARSLVPRKSDKTFMVVNIGKVNSVLSIVSDKNVWLSYTMKLGGDFFTKMISKCLTVSQDEAEKLKFSKGLSRAPENQELLFCLAPAVSSLRDEIIKHYWYWNTHKTEIEGAKEIEKIIVCGSQSNINAITDYLSMSLGLNVVLGNPWINLMSFDKYIPEIGAREATDFATAVGLAMKSLVGETENNIVNKKINDKSSSDTGKK